MKYISFVFAYIAMIAPLVAQAEDANAQKALQKAQYMLRQATNEKAELQTQVDALKQQVEKLMQDVAATKTAADQAKRTTEDKYGNAIEQWKQRDTQRSDELASLKQQLNQEIVQKREIESKLQKQSNNFAVCYANNRKLYDLNGELLARYENKGFGDVLKQREPFTGIKQVDIENLVQDYRYRIDDLKIPGEAAAAAVKSESGIIKNN